ncbi:MAG: glutamate--tRNA ligase family protein, partial [Planctomycetota bacterium]
LGLDWDVGPVVQGADLSRFRDAMQRLAASGAVYPCSLSRQEIASAVSAPNEGDEESRFPPELRPQVLPEAFEDTGMNWRLVVDAGRCSFDDEVAGPVVTEPAASVGDFVVWTKRGHPAYQLAVVVDDDAQGVTDVVRGDDLIDSTGRQMLVMDALGITRRPTYYHVPLVRGTDGRRLAKRHGDTRLTTLADRGVAAERVVGLLASWCGVCDRPQPMGAAAFRETFTLDTLPPGDVVYDEEARRWLETV